MLFPLKRSSVRWTRRFGIAVDDTNIMSINDWPVKRDTDELTDIS